MVMKKECIYSISCPTFVRVILVGQRDAIEKPSNCSFRMPQMTGGKQQSAATAATLLSMIFSKIKLVLRHKTTKFAINPLYIQQIQNHYDKSYNKSFEAKNKWLACLECLT